MIGWISIHRRIQDHWIFQDPVYFQWWIIVLLNVNQKGTKFPVNNEFHTCLPGSSFRSLDSWSGLFGCSKKTTVKFFKLLENDQMIAREVVGSGNRRKHLLTVVNWDKYQKKETENYTERKLKTTPKMPPNNNENNENNEDKGIPPRKESLYEYFKEKKSSALEADKFYDHYQSNGWKVSGRAPMKDWKAAARNWIRNEKKFEPAPQTQSNYKKLPVINE